MKKVAGKKKIKKVMKEFKEGELHSGSKTGPRVDSRKQAVAIALSESRKGNDDRTSVAGRPTSSRTATVVAKPRTNSRSTKGE